MSFSATWVNQGLLTYEMTHRCDSKLLKKSSDLKVQRATTFVDCPGRSVCLWHKLYATSLSRFFVASLIGTFRCSTSDHQTFPLETFQVGTFWKFQRCYRLRLIQSMVDAEVTWWTCSREALTQKSTSRCDKMRGRSWKQTIWIGSVNRFRAIKRWTRRVVVSTVITTVSSRTVSAAGSACSNGKPEQSVDSTL